MLLVVIYIIFGAFSEAASSNTTDGHHSPPTTSWEAQPNRRGTFQLLISCLLTLTLCVWTALHVNVQAEDATQWHRIRTKFTWALFGIFAPELVVYVAYTQYVKAAWLHKEMQHALSQHVSQWLETFAEH